MTNPNTQGPYHMDVRSWVVKRSWWQRLLCWLGYHRPGPVYFRGSLARTECERCWRTLEQLPSGEWTPIGE